MHLIDTQLLASQQHSADLRRATQIHDLHSDSQSTRRPIRATLGDALVGAGQWLTTLGDRLLPAASPPPGSASRAGAPGACAGC
jgi:hypothetical protein